MNARIAANLGAPVVLAVKAKDRTPEQVAQVVDVCLAELAAQHAHTARGGGQPLRPGATGRGRRRRSKRSGPRRYVLPEEPLLVAPSVAELRNAVEGTLLRRRPGAAVPRGDGRAGGRHDAPSTCWSG